MLWRIWSKFPYNDFSLSYTPMLFSIMNNTKNILYATWHSLISWFGSSLHSLSILKMGTKGKNFPEDRSYSIYLPSFKLYQIIINECVCARAHLSVGKLYSDSQLMSRLARRNVWKRILTPVKQTCKIFTF